MDSPKHRHTLTLFNRRKDGRYTGKYRPSNGLPHYRPNLESQSRLSRALNPALFAKDLQLDRQSEGAMLTSYDECYKISGQTTLEKTPITFFPQYPRRLVFYTYGLPRPHVAGVC